MHYYLKYVCKTFIELNKQIMKLGRKVNEHTTNRRGTKGIISTEKKMKWKQNFKKCRVLREMQHELIIKLYMPCSFLTRIIRCLSCKHFCSDGLLIFWILKDAFKEGCGKAIPWNRCVFIFAMASKLMSCLLGLLSYSNCEDLGFYS